MKNLEKISSILLASTAVLLLTAGISSAQKASEQLFEKALYAEEMKGDLAEAVKLYQQVLERKSRITGRCLPGRCCTWVCAMKNLDRNRPVRLTGI